MEPLKAPGTQERAAAPLPGWAGLLLILALKAVAAFLITIALRDNPENPQVLPFVSGLLVLAVASLAWAGMFIVQPNQAMVLTLFGRYTGSVKQDGWHYTNPFVSKKKISRRVHNFTSQQLKVNDADGNPIEIAAVVVWRVVDTARATFDVENYLQFVEVQSETALRHLASEYPYDDGQHPGEPSLRGSADTIAQTLKTELQARLDLAGLQVMEARLSHLAYSPEIAGAMLQRQQAAAVIAARQKIVEGAVGMVEMALALLGEKQVVQLSVQEKSQLVSNLLVVLTSDRAAHPVLPVARQG